MKIEKVGDSEIMYNKFDKTFIKQAKDINIDINYRNFIYTVKDDSDEVIGGMHGYKLFREVYINKLCINENFRGQGIGRKLLDIVENEVCDDNIDYIILTINGFQEVVEFYKKYGFEIEFIRDNKNPKFISYSMIKKLK